MADYRQINLSDWNQSGLGGNGATYENPAQPDLLLKVNKRGNNSLAFVKKDFDISKAVEGLGLPVPKMLEIVRVGNAYGVISERIKGKKSISRICHDNPEQIEEMARLLCREVKILSSTPCDQDFFPNRKEQLKKALKKIRFIGEKNKAILADIVNDIPETNTCSHGDLNPGNLILVGEKHYWIDLDRFGFGCPMLDVGHLYQTCIYYSSLKQVQDLFHMTEAQLRLFWDAFAKEYSGQEDHSEFDKEALKYACLDMLVSYETQELGLAKKLFFAYYICRFIKQF